MSSICFSENPQSREDELEEMQTVRRKIHQRVSHINGPNEINVPNWHINRRSPFNVDNEPNSNRGSGQLKTLTTVESTRIQLTSQSNWKSLWSMRSSSQHSFVTTVAECGSESPEMDSPKARPTPNVHSVTLSWKRGRRGLHLACYEDIFDQVSRR